MPAPDRVAPGRGLAGALHSRTALLLAFSFAVMADPVSSGAYAIEAALRGLPIISLAAALGIAAVLYRAWVRAGRPRGIRNVAAEAEEVSE